MSKKRRRRDLTPDAIIHRVASDPLPDEFERQFAHAFVRLLAARVVAETKDRRSAPPTDLHTYNPTSRRPSDNPDNCAGTRVSRGDDSEQSNE